MTKLKEVVKLLLPEEYNENLRKRLKVQQMDSRNGFTEDDQEALANAAQTTKRNRFSRGGLGFSAEDEATGGGEAGGAASRDTSFKPGQKGNIQLDAASHYNARNDKRRRLDSDLATLQQKNLNNWV